MSKRKAWEDLSPQYRKRLQRAGITKRQHESGTGLVKARGHQYTKPFNDWIAFNARMYGRDEQMMRAELAGFKKAEIFAGIQLQQKAEAAYNEGRLAEATRLWKMRDRSLPDWMFYYHGYFS